MKTCPKCKLTKDESEFNRDKSKKSGLSVYCRACANAYARKYQQENKAEFRKGGRFYKARPDRKRNPESGRRYKEANREKVNAAARVYAERHAEDVRGYARRYHQENRDRYLAAKAVQKAIYHKVIRPAKQCICADCGKQATHYHHESYAEQDRLNVVALCGSCHKKRHMSSKV